MIRIARLLPLVTVLAWVITVFLPVLDSGNLTGPRIVVTSLGGDPLDPSGIKPPYVFAWLGVVGCAVLAWLLRSLTWWSVVTMIVTLALAVLLVSMISDPPSLLWDGVDARGHPTGGMERGAPAPGMLAWLLGIAALGVSAVLGLVGTRRSVQDQRPAKTG